jgi:arylsulfatase A-like enzyme/Tfp pilus assembly protein PilF
MAKNKKKVKSQNKIEKEKAIQKKSKFKVIFILPLLLLVIISIFLLKIVFKDLRGGEDWNVLIITLDTTRADRIGCYGYGKARTPNLDRLAQEGVKFENAYCQVPLTLPSHCSIFTGTYPLFHGVRNNGSYKLSDKIETLAEVLRSRGWKTSAFVASFSLDSRFGLDQGFEVYDDEMGEERIKTFLSERRAVEVYEAFRRWYRGKGEGKWFCWVHFYDPHLPYDPPEPWRREIEDRYDGEIAYMDEYVGKVLEEVEGERDRTLIVIVGDHGESLGEHGERDHGIFLYEVSMRVPLIMVAPKKFPEKKVIRSNVRLIDIAPTILDFLKIEKSEKMQGESLLPYISGKKKKDLPFYMETVYPRESFNWSELKGVVDGEWKYIFAPKEELYNIKKDPHENNNLFEREKERAENMKILMESMEKKYSSGISGKRTLTREDEERLRSLGYIGGDFSSEKGGVLPDPKDKLESLKLLLDAKECEYRKDLRCAIEKYEELIKIDPEIPLSYHYLGRIYHRLGQYEKAVEVIKKGLDINPDSYQLLSQLSAIYTVMGKMEEALQSAKRALEIKPDFFEALVAIGWILSHSNRPQESLYYYEKALKIEPENKLLNIDYAYSLLLCGQVQKALEIYNRLKEKYPDDYKIYQELGITYSAIRDFERAYENLYKAVQLNPSPETFYNMAVMLSQAGKIEMASHYLKLFLNSARPDDPRRKSAEMALSSWEKKK